ncbi:MAG: 50S ribosomal protein L23 [Haloplanus sp.]
MSSVIDHPLVTEKAMNQMDFDNKLQFVVSLDATKADVADAVEGHYDVTVTKVNTQVTSKGEKKAVVSLSADDDAQEIASRIGVF